MGANRNNDLTLYRNRINTKIMNKIRDFIIIFLCMLMLSIIMWGTQMISKDNECHRIASVLGYTDPANSYYSFSKGCEILYNGEWKSVDDFTVILKEKN
jgi:hypothetical protein